VEGESEGAEQSNERQKQEEAWSRYEESAGVQTLRKQVRRFETVDADGGFDEHKRERGPSAFQGRAEPFVDVR
jgi:hypothetical protein